MHGTLMIVAIGDYKDDAASWHGADGLRDRRKSIPEMDGISAVGGSCFPGAMELRKCDGRVQRMRDAVAVAGRNVIRCADEEAVDGVDRDVIMGLERLVCEGQNGTAEGGLQIERVTTEIEQDGEVDRIVTFESYMGWVKAWTRVEADVERVEIDGRKLRERWT